MADAKKPIPLSLDWSSDAGRAHMIQMANLSEDDAVRLAHEENVENDDTFPDAAYSELCEAAAKRRSGAAHDAEMVAILDKHGG